MVMPMNLGILANTGALRHALDAAGVPYVGPPADAADLAGHKLRLEANAWSDASAIYCDVQMGKAAGSAKHADMLKDVHA